MEKQLFIVRLISVLTSLFYYNHYRPYTIKENGDDNLKKKIKLHELSSKFQGKDFLLNKSCNNDVVSFARNISFSITGLRESARKLEDSISKIQHFNWYSSLDSKRHWLKADFKNFVATFNDAYKFSLNQDHNTQLAKFAETIKQYAQEIKNNSKIRFKDSFLNFNEEKDLVFDEAKYDLLEFKLFLGICSDFKKIAVDIKNETEMLLVNPLTSFMNFNNLDSYYSYKFGSKNDNTYKIIENGMLFDLII